MKSSALKRRWHQFTLRGLLIVVTVTAVALGGRIEYLRRMAVYHEREAARYQAMDFDLEILQKSLSHQEIAREFRAAITRPWRTVDESLRPLPNLPTPLPGLIDK
jgi:hypothetical protein